MQHQKDETAVASAQNFPNDLTKYNNLNYASTAVLPTSDAHESELNSYLGRVNYSFKHKYNVTATLRADGSSKLGTNNRWGYFPSIGLSWNVNQEQFFQSLAPTFSALKIRVSAGQTGNSEGAALQFPRGINTNELLFQQYVGYGCCTGAKLPTRILDGKQQHSMILVWKQASSRAVLMLCLMCIIRKQATCYCMFLFLYILATQALCKMWAVLRTKALNSALIQNNIQRKDFSWNTTLVFASNKNKILSLGEGTDFYFPIAPTGYVSPVIVKVGLPVGTFWGYDTDGLLTEDDIAKGAPILAGVPQQVGDRKYIDTNGDGVVNASDRHDLGSAQPEFTFGLSNTISYKGFDFSFLFQGSYGNKIFNFLEQKLELTTVTLNAAGKLVDRYSATNPMALCQGQPMHRYRRWLTFILKTALM
jgi:hypothetical protein